MARDVEEFVADDLWLLIAIVTVVLTSLVGLAGLEALAGAVSIVGFVLLVPIFLFWGEEIAEWYYGEDDTSASASDDPLEELKRRYAEGEIDTEEFERRVDRLVGVETYPDEPVVRDESTADRSADTDWEPEDAFEPETDREPEREPDR